MRREFPLAVAFAVAIFIVAANGQQNDRQVGISLYREGRFAEAVSLLQTASDTDKNDRAALVYLGASYAHMNKHASAQKAFRKATLVRADSDTDYDTRVKVTSRPRPQTNDIVRRMYNFGSISVAVELLSTGKIGFVFPLQNSLSEWEPEVVAAAKAIRFQPAISGGKPVTVVVILEYSFSIG